MKILILFCVFFFSGNIAFPQINQEANQTSNCIRGIWSGENQIKEPFADISSEYLIFKDKLVLQIILKDPSYNIAKWYLQSISNRPNELSRINLDSLENRIIDNKPFFYTQSISFDKDFRLNKNENGKYLYNVWPFLSCDDYQLLYFYGEYDRKKEIPDNVVKFIIEKSKNNKEDNLLYFIDKKVLRINVEKAYLYSLSKQKTNSYLIDGDIVILQEEFDQWVKVKYYGDKVIEVLILKATFDLYDSVK
jgi:hypothetical protein